jgi:hypothetical protein
MVEELVDGREIECAVMGNDEPQASLPGEYVIHEESARFLDYTEKYSSTGNVEFIVPAHISKSVIRKIQSMAAKAYKAIDASGLSRVDFFLKKDGELARQRNQYPAWFDRRLGLSKNVGSHGHTLHTCHRPAYSVCARKASRALTKRDKYLG